MYINSKNPAESFRKHLTEAADAIEKVYAAHAAETERLKALSSIGTFTKVFAFVSAPTINVAKVSRSIFYSSHTYISFCYRTKDGWDGGTSLDFPATEEGVKLAIEKARSIWAEGEKTHAANLAAHEENVRIFNRCLDLLNACGFNTTEEKYNNRKHKTESVPATWRESLNSCFPRYTYVSFDFEAHLVRLTATMKQIVKDVETEKAKKEAEKKAAALANPLIPEAVAYLTQRGKNLGTDYILETAVDVANEIAAEELIASHKGEMVEFSGDDECSGCDGWDGESPRCECGGRRVGWVRSYGHSFKTPAVHAEAN